MILIRLSWRLFPLQNRNSSKIPNPIKSMPLTLITNTVCSNRDGGFFSSIQCGSLLAHVAQCRLTEMHLDRTSAVPPLQRRLYVAQWAITALHRPAKCYWNTIDAVLSAQRVGCDTLPRDHSAEEALLSAGKLAHSDS